MMIYLMATEGLEVSDSQAKELGQQGCYAPTIFDEYKHHL